MCRVRLRTVKELPQLTQWVNLRAGTVSQSSAQSPGVFLLGAQARFSEKEKEIMSVGP